MSGAHTILVTLRPLKYVTPTHNVAERLFQLMKYILAADPNTLKGAADPNTLKGFRVTLFIYWSVIIIMTVDNLLYIAARFQGHSICAINYTHHANATNND